LEVGLAAAVVVLVKELAQRSALVGGFVASLPLTSLLAFVALWWATSDRERVAQLSTSIFWLVLPSLPLFAVFPFLLRRGLGFAPSLALACALTAACYAVLLRVLVRFGVVA
jgi:hypothetical protein